MMSLHVHQVLPKPSAGVSLPPISSLLGSVDTSAKAKLEAMPHDTLLVQHTSGHSLPVLIPQDLPDPTSSVPSSSAASLVHYSHARPVGSDISRSNSGSSLHSNSPVLDNHVSGASILSSLAATYQHQPAAEAHHMPPHSIAPEAHPQGIDKKSRKYRCKTCEKSFTTSGHLARHARIHTGERKHACPHPGCQARFARQDNCMQHFRTHKATKSIRRPKRK